MIQMPNTHIIKDEKTTTALGGLPRLLNLRGLVNVRSFLAALFLMTLASCGDTVFEKKLNVPGENWTYQDTLKFDYSIEDTTKVYGLFLEVEHSTDFGFQNLYVQMHTRFPSGKTEKQMVSLELSGKSGIWNGDCGGGTCVVEIPLQVKTVFKERGAYQLAVEQFMRQSLLPGVESMTLKIREVKEKR